MSFMPNVGTVVRMLDGRIAIVTDFNHDGSADKVMFEDGHEEPTDAWQIAETLTDREQDSTTEPTDPLAVLREYVRKAATR
jgi:hypothetical protein